MQEKTQWDEVLKELSLEGISNLTLQDFEMMVLAVATVAQEDISPGTILAPTTSGDGSSSSAVVELESYAVLRLMAAHWQLRCWMARNGYATSLPVWRTLNSYTLGAKAVMESCSAVTEYMLLAGADER